MAQIKRSGPTIKPEYQRIRQHLDKMKNGTRFSSRDVAKACRCTARAAGVMLKNDERFQYYTLEEGCWIWEKNTADHHRLRRATVAAPGGPKMAHAEKVEPEKPRPGLKAMKKQFDFAPELQ